MATTSGYAYAEANAAPTNTNNHEVHVYTGTRGSSGVDSAFELAAGSSISLNLYQELGIAFTPTVNSVEIWIMRDAHDLDSTTSSNAIRRYISGTDFTLQSTSGNRTDTLTFWATSDGTSTGTPMSGTYRIYIIISRTLAATTTVQRSDNGGAVPAGYTGINDRGYLRAGLNSATVTIGQTVGSAATLPVAWPESLFTRIAAQRALTNQGSTNITTSLRKPSDDALITGHSLAWAASTSSDNLDSGAIALDTRIDTAIGGAAPHTFRVQHEITGLSTLTGRPWTHFHTVPTGYTGAGTDGGAQTTKDVKIRRSDQTWNSTCTLTLQSNPDTTTFKYQRGERLPLSGNVVARLLNARSLAFAARTADSFRTKNNNTNDATGLEATLTVAAHNHTTGDHDLNGTFGSADGAQSNPDGTGTSKYLYWTDTAANSPSAVSGQVGLLFSGARIKFFLQTNDNTIPTSANSYRTTFRKVTMLSSDLGYVYAVVTKARGNPDGTSSATVVPLASAVGTIKLRDDKNQVTALTYACTTSADGVSLLTSGSTLPVWDSTKPGGLWDIWADGTDSSVSFTVGGNTATFARKATNSGDFTMLAASPAIIVMASCGPVSTGAGDHTHSDQDIQVGLAVIDVAENILKAVDAGRQVTDGVTTNGSTTVTSATANFTSADLQRLLIGSGIPAGARITTINSTTSVTISAAATATASGVTLNVGIGAAAMLARFQHTGPNIGRPEYLHNSTFVWTQFNGSTDGTTLFHELPETIPGSSRAYVRTFTAAETAGWGTYDIFVVGKATLDGTPYRGGDKEVVTDLLNAHNKYSFDPTGGMFR